MAVGLIGRCGHLFNFLNDVELFLQVGLLLFFLLQEQFGSLFANDAHLGFKHLLVFVRHHLIGFGVAAAIKIRFHACLALGNV